MDMLTNKVAIITGASSGIGLAAAQIFAEQGAKLVLVARRAALLNQLINTLPLSEGNAVAVVGDVSHEACAKAAVDTAMERFGRLDIAFNNAGALGAMGPTPDVDLAAWDDTLETNLTSAFLASKYQLPALVKTGGGSLIFTVTFVGYTVALPEMAAYAASKAGIIGLMKVLAVEFGHQNIRVNAIAAGGTDTPMGRSVADTADARAFVQSLHALKRIAQPQEIAQAALYLASDHSSFTTGSVMMVDGGASISRT